MITDRLIDSLVEGLRELPDGTEITVFELVRHCGFDAMQLVRDDEMFTIYNELIKAARKAHITLKWSVCEDYPVGLPYNIPFIVRNSRT